MPRLLVINGPNLNLLGTRQPEVYGTTTLAELEDLCTTWAATAGFEIDTFQSNHEGALIDRLHAARTTADAVIINAGAYTHTSYALHDAILAIELPTVEVHISNVAEREPWRALSVIGPACERQIYGRGVEGYRWAVEHLAALLSSPPRTVHYGPLDDHVADLRVPDEPGPHRVAVLVHGGFWRHYWTREIMDGLAVDLTAHGWATWNIEYRRVGAGGGWPLTALDVALAVDHLADLAGDADLDLDRVAVIGHSAGGHLALWDAARATQPSGTVGSDPLIHPRVAVGLAAISDLHAAADVGDGAVGAFLADAPSHADLYRSASPIEAVPFGIPTVLVHGDADEAVPVDLSRSFAEAARHGGDSVELIELAGVGHMELIDPTHPAWIATREALDRAC
ncbi:MAG: type II 3-dehydroquinate dehydratase [Acidimicrobiia bacterium]|nr:type II 3-dehydroquinate dehydratase [Acidimicrobiia bacterium]